jgi:long-chain acyl-CoA synthetase
MNLATLAETAAERLGERRSLNFEGTWITNFESLDQARRCQTAFAGLGLKRGDIVVLCMINHPVVYPIFQGIFRSGAAAVPVMFMLTAPELRFVLEDTRATGVVTDTFNLPKVLQAVEGLDHIRWIAVREGKDKTDATPPQFGLEALIKAEPTNTLADIDPGDTALMLYTSGTTGKPKGVMLTHANLIASAEAAADAAELDNWTQNRISISAMPMAHIFGVGVMCAGYLTPEHMADSYLYQMQWFEPRKFMQGIQEHKANTMASVPTMLSMILNHPDNPNFDLSSLEEVICGAAPLPVELAQEFMRRYNCRVREIYGMTENAGIATANRPSDAYRPGSCGRPYKGVDLKIVDDSGNEVPTGQRGEVVTRGPATMKGYHNRPEATAETLRNGWLHTGDIGYLDEDGFLFIVDRKKDMIIKGGENIYPAELEDVLYRHPGVAEAAIVGIPDPVHGEAVVAFVVPKKGQELTEAEILKFMAGEVTKYKLPTYVHFRDALPKVGVGKILRRELREEASKKAAETASAG